MTIQPLRGFRDFLPADAKKRQWLRNEMIKVFERWGYAPLETPTLEPYELFKGEVGEDEKLFYKFTDFGDREVMLRYDQTVPSCRVVGQNSNNLVFPFRRYQIQSNFRAEKPQAGRFREFVQADADIYGVASVYADAEIIAVMLDVYRSLGFPKAVALINNRELLKDIPYPAIASMDKLEKIGETGVIADMQSKGISESQAISYLKTVKDLKPDTSINSIFSYLDDCGFQKDWYRFEPTLARSFSYSQGPIWEIKIPGYTVGSVGGGERYDALIEKISGQKIPGTGFGIGFDRTLEACEQFNLIPSLSVTPRVLVSIFSPDFYSPALRLSCSLRNGGIPTELYPDPDIKLDKQLKYASRRGIPYVAILGPEELEKNLIGLKYLETGVQSRLTLENTISLLRTLSP
jgi:histidyl-tRNA synthetase